MTEKYPEALKTIGEVSEELSLASHVLRFWENKFSQLKPVKIKGRRYYNPSNIKIIKKIKELLHEHGYTIKGVQKLNLKNEILNSNTNEFEDKESVSSENQKQIALTQIYKNLNNLYDKITDNLEKI